MRGRVRSQAMHASSEEGGRGGPPLQNGETNQGEGAALAGSADRPGQLVRRETNAGEAGALSLEQPVVPSMSEEGGRGGPPLQIQGIGEDEIQEAALERGAPRGACFAAAEGWVVVAGLLRAFGAQGGVGGNGGVGAFSRASLAKMVARGGACAPKRRAHSTKSAFSNVQGACNAISRAELAKKEARGGGHLRVIHHGPGRCAHSIQCTSANVLGACDAISRAELANKEARGGACGPKRCAHSGGSDGTIGPHTPPWVRYKAGVVPVQCLKTR